MAMPLHAEVRPIAARDPDTWGGHDVPLVSQPLTAQTGMQNHALQGEIRTLLEEHAAASLRNLELHHDWASHDQVSTSGHEQVLQRVSDLLASDGAQVARPDCGAAGSFSRSATGVRSGAASSDGRRCSAQWRYNGLSPRFYRHDLFAGWPHIVRRIEWRIGRQAGYRFAAQCDQRHRPKSPSAFPWPGGVRAERCPFLWTSRYAAHRPGNRDAGYCTRQHPLHG